MEFLFIYISGCLIASLFAINYLYKAIVVFEMKDIYAYTLAKQVIVAILFSWLGALIISFKMYSLKSLEPIKLEEDEPITHSKMIEWLKEGTEDEIRLKAAILVSEHENLPEFMKKDKQLNSVYEYAKEILKK